MADKWDVFEVIYRSIIFVAIVGGIGYFAWQLLEILRMNTHWIAYPLGVVVTFAWLLVLISTTAWLVLVAKGTFRPKDELDMETGIDVDDFTIEPEEYEPENK